MNGAPDTMRSLSIEAEPSRPLRADPFARDVVTVLGLPFDVCGIDGAVERIRAAAFSRTRCVITTPNLNFIVAARTDAAFRDAMLCSDLSLVDGAPIVWCARALGLPLRERVAGASVFDALRAHTGRPVSVYFFGGPEGAAAAACERLNATAGGLHCVGFDPGGFGSIDDMSRPETIARVNASGAEFVVVSLGAKKGQAWITRNAETLRAPLLCHLGAVVNFVAGTVVRAPPWVQKANLEWLWRIKEEPGLWQRYRRDGAAALTLALTRILPNALRRWRRRTSRPPTIETSDSGPGTEFRLAGSWTAASLGPLRQALRDAAPGTKAVVVSMRDVAAVDSAFIALMMIAAGSLGHGRLRLAQVPPAIRTIFWYNAAEYLLDPVAAPTFTPIDP